jgi:hypothetical protein
VGLDWYFALSILPISLTKIVVSSDAKGLWSGSQEVNYVDDWRIPDPAPAVSVYVGGWNPGKSVIHLFTFTTSGSILTFNCMQRQLEYT